MAIEKGLYSAPEGIEEGMLGDMGIAVNVTPLDGMDDMDGLEGELLGGDVEIIELEDGGVEIILGAEVTAIEDLPFDANLAEYMTDDALSSLSSDLNEAVQGDIDSRREWVDTFIEGMKIIGFKYEERTDPWDGACGVFSNVLAEAAIRFQAETMSETFPASGPVRTKILGEETKAKQDAAARVQADMNYELTESMVEYRPEHERMLYSLGLAGSAFKKVYYDPNLGRQTALYISAEDVVVPYGETHINMAERVTHIMRRTKNEVARAQADGFYRDVDLGEPTEIHTDIEKKKAEEGGFTLTNDGRYTMYEIHADLVMEDYDECMCEGGGLARPYIVTIDCGTGDILAVRRNWLEEDELYKKQQFFTHYVYVPGFGFYGLGLIHIIGGYAQAGTSLIRQLVDAGTLSNLPGGIKARGMRIKGDDTPIAPGEWKDVDVPSGTIRDNIMPLPYKEPSQTLLALLDRITQEGRRLGAISDMNISDMSANAPVGTTLALLERTLKPMAAVQARVHYSMKLEFKMLKNIMADYASEDYGYQPLTGEVTARRSDYAMVDVIPVSDPNSSTMAQRVVQHQAVLQMAQQAPQIYDLPQLHRQMIEVLGVKNADKLVPMASDLKPADPVSENMAVLVGKPIKAFIYQEHASHIASHQAFMQDPMIAQSIGQNPQAQQIMAALHAHIAEHIGFQYRSQIEEKLGVMLPAPDTEMTEDIEINLARLVADAGKQLTQSHQQQAAQQQAQQQAQDPVVQMQQQELAIKQADTQRKQKKDDADIQLRGAEQQRKQQKDATDAQFKSQELEIDRAELSLEARKGSTKLKNQKTIADDRIQMDLLREGNNANKRK